MRIMIRGALVVVLGLLPGVVSAQFGGGFGRGGGGGGFGRGGGGDMTPAPKLPGAELDGPPDSATAQSLLTLTDTQSGKYAQAYDSFMVATHPTRDSAQAALNTMHDRLDAGDRAAALFYADRLQDLGRVLKDRQDKFDDDLHHLLTGDQMKAYRRWKEDQDRAAEDRNRAEAMRWRQSQFAGRGGGGGGGGEGGRLPALPEPRSFVPAPAGVAHPDLGSTAVRIGRTVYVGTQLALDSTGAVVGVGDLRTQAERAFANLSAVLRAASAWPQDVVSLTIYVVDYTPSELSQISDAGAAFFGVNPPVTTVLGVQSLAREGALIAVSATAVTGGGFGREAERER
ncbi:MAG TPA: RidA family protein [Gemmatimonadales bacterium]|nr:RidA family protein [Gemmatimonadales bacterium]